MSAAPASCHGLPLLLAALALLPAPAAPQAGEPVAFQSHGATLRGTWFRSDLGTPAPAVLLLHGAPGAPGDVLGLGAAAAADGWNVLAFSMRGFHASEGRVSLEGSIEDVESAVAFLRAEGGRLGAADGPVAVVGYSFGGWVALMSGIRYGEIGCVGAIAPANFGLQGRIGRGDPSVFEPMRRSVESARREGLARSGGWEAMRDEMLANADAYDPALNAAALADNPVLVVGGWRDQGPTLETYIAPLVRALRAAGNERVTPVTLDDDHALRAKRTELHEGVVGWLRTGCR